jgi:hypothetical protein
MENGRFAAGRAASGNLSVRTRWGPRFLLMVHIASSELVLETFCRAVVVEMRLAALLRESYPLEDTDFAALARLHRSEAMLVANIAGKLRLTVRATRKRDTRKLPAVVGHS